MDGDKQEKSVLEKMVDKVNDAVENLVNTASAAAMKAMEPDETMAGRGSAQMYMPLAADGMVTDPILMAPMSIAPAPGKKRTAPKKTVTKNTRKVSAKKVTTKAAKKS